MKKVQKFTVMFLCLLFLAVSALSICFFNKNAYAQTSENDYEGVDSEQEVTPRLFATISISLNGGNGKVWATAKNDFTLFPSTVYVRVELYYSDTYCTDYSKMTLATVSTTGDLNMGDTIVAESSTEGKDRYWLARLTTRENSGDLIERVIDAHYSADGTFLG